MLRTSLLNGANVPKPASIPQAQLDGFKTRLLRAAEAPAQRHLYVTEWRALDTAQARAGAGAGAISGAISRFSCTFYGVNIR